MATKFSKRHYEVVAKVLKGVKEVSKSKNEKPIISFMISSFVLEFERDNSLFDKERFIEAVTG